MTKPVSVLAILCSPHWLSVSFGKHIFNISHQLIFVGFRDFKSFGILKMFALVSRRHLRLFFVQIVHIRHRHLVQMSPKRFDSSFPQDSLKNAFLHWIQTRNSTRCCHLFISLLKMSSTVSF